MKERELAGGVVVHHVPRHARLGQDRPPVVLVVPPFASRVDSPEVVNSLLHAYRGGFQVVAFDWP
jgi:hypothetical protein